MSSCHVRLGARKDGRAPRIRDFLPLAPLDDLVFGGWDIFPDDAYAAAVDADVLSANDLDPVREELSRITPMRAVFDPAYVRRLDGPHVKTGRSKADLVAQLRDDTRCS